MSFIIFFAWFMAFLGLVLGAGMSGVAYHTWSRRSERAASPVKGRLGGHQLAIEVAFSVLFLGLSMAFFAVL
ncbi:hypothetical protein ACFQ7N_10155 [Streptomyces niveus]|uniref:hypothetical protein n=1 Tax=Streptomyces niveus TaxID=193462 RepID=UPI0036B17DAB